MGHAMAFDRSQELGKLFVSASEHPVTSSSPKLHENQLGSVQGTEAAPRSVKPKTITFILVDLGWRWQKISEQVNLEALNFVVSWWA